MATTRLMTIEDLADLGDEPGRYDLIRGELIRTSPAHTKHGAYASRIVGRLQLYVDEHDAGEVYTAEAGFILARDPDVLLAPDVAFVRRHRLPPENEQTGFFELAPDIAVEVVSPSDRLRDVSDKVMEYLEGGVSLVWVVEPGRKLVTTYKPDRTSKILTVDDELDGGDVLPGFRMPVADVFR